MSGIKTKVMKWAKEIGSKEAKDRLMAAGMSYSIASKLLSGNYGPTPGPLVEKAINEAMGMKVYE